MKKLGVDDVKGYIDRHIAIIPNGHHIDLHGAGWNKDWSDWVSKNRAIETCNERYEMIQIKACYAELLYEMIK